MTFETTFSMNPDTAVFHSPAERGAHFSIEAASLDESSFLLGVIANMAHKRASLKNIKGFKNGTGTHGDCEERN